MTDIARLTATDFDAYVGKSFQGSPTGHTQAEVGLVLVSVTRRGAVPGFREPFTLELLGPASPVLAQGTYRLDHPEHGPLELFMVPVGAGAEGVRYEIAFG